MGDTAQRHLIRQLVYAMLVLSAGMCLIFGDGLWAAWRHGHVPLLAPLLAPLTFVAFVIVYALDRYWLIRHAHYPFARAAFQLGSALVFLTLLLPHQAMELRQKKPFTRSITRAALLLLDHEAPAIRAAACQLLDGGIALSLQQRMLALQQYDQAMEVRASCEQALQRCHVDHRLEALPVPGLTKP